MTKLIRKVSAFMRGIFMLVMVAALLVLVPLAVFFVYSVTSIGLLLGYAINYIGANDVGNKPNASKVFRQDIFEGGKSKGNP